MFHRRSAPHPGNRDARDGRQVAFENTPGRLIELLEARTLLSAGDLDPSFGLGGMVHTPLPLGAWATALDVRNGRVVIGGEIGSFDSQNNLANGEIALAVFDSGGNPVTSFSGDGVLTQTLGDSTGIVDLAVQSDNKILVLARHHAMDGTVQPSILARFTASGTLDTTFGGGDGQVSVPFGQHLALAPDGRIVVAGVAGDRQIGVARFTSSGTLEKQLLSSVARVADFSLPPFVDDVLVRSDGKVVVAGSAPETTPNPYRNNDAMIVRFKSDLTGVDTSFGGGDGIVRYNGDYNDPDNVDSADVMTLDSQGRLLVSISLLTGDPTVHRLLDNGSDDPSFTKETIAGQGQAAGLSVAPDGKIIWSGFIASHPFTYLARLNPNGGFDTSFGEGDGIVSTLSNTQEPAGAFSDVQSDGRIITAGTNDGFIAYRHVASNSTPVGSVTLGTDGVLRITGTDAGNDNPRLEEANGTGPDSFLVYMNGKSYSFDRAKIKSVDINTLGGNDQVTDLDDGASSARPRTIHGGKGNDILYGGGGKDLIAGEDGNDQIHAGGGDDTIIDGPGTDLIDGGPGADTVDYSYRTGPVHVDLEGDADDGPAGEHDTVMPTIEHIIGSKGNDTLIGDGRPNFIDGRGGNDTIYGGGGNDTLVGGTGQDKLYGQDGNDFLDARDGITDFVLDGGSGTDTAKKDNSDPTTSIEVLYTGP